LLKTASRIPLEQYYILELEGREKEGDFPLHSEEGHWFSLVENS